MKKITKKLTVLNSSILIALFGFLAGELLTGCTKEPAIDSTPKNFYLGWTTQSLKADDVEIVDGRGPDGTIFQGFKKGSDGFYYSEVQTNADSKNPEITMNDGRKITLGEKYFFKVEPIEWKILDYQTGLAMTSKITFTSQLESYWSDETNVVDTEESERQTAEAKAEDPEAEEITVYKKIPRCAWFRTNIRARLNNYDASIYRETNYTSITRRDKMAFIQNRFTDFEKELILVSEVDNSTESTIDTSNFILPAMESCCSQITNDKIFLLSMKELTNSKYGFASYKTTGKSSGRLLNTTDSVRAGNPGSMEKTYAKNYGLMQWWTRSPALRNTDTNYVHFVGNMGGVYASDLTTTSKGVVPAIHVDIEKVMALQETYNEILNNGMNDYGKVDVE